MDLERPAATLFCDGRAVLRTPVGVGTPSDVLRLGRLMPIGTPLTVR